MAKTRVIIAGGREFDDRALLNKTLDEMYQNQPTEWVVLSGMARGADKLGYQWALDNRIETRQYPADWNKFGRGAGFIRNTAMAKDADVLVAFWDGESRGTAHMIQEAVAHGLLIHITRYRRGGDGVVVRHES